MNTARYLIQALARRHPDLILAINQPYSIDSETDWFIPRYAEACEVPHCLIEIRNDQIDHPEGAAFWAELLSVSIAEVMEQLP